MAECSCFALDSCFTDPRVRKLNWDELRFILREATISNDAEAIEALLDELNRRDGISLLSLPCERDPKQYCAIHYAAQLGHVGIVETMLNSDPELLEATTARGRTPLMLAAVAGKVDVARLLLDRGADVDKVDKSMNETAMHFACYFNHLNIVELLLENRRGTQRHTMMEARNAIGSTPLHSACNGGSVPIIRLLMYVGADIAAKNVFGSGAEWYATRCDDPAKKKEITAFLQQLRAF